MPALPAALHLVLSLCAWRLGVDIHGGPLSWDAFWQTLPLATLRQDLVGSVLSLHAQPPLHNLLVGLLAKLSEHPLSWLHGLHVLLGAGLCALASGLIATATGSARLGIGVGCFAALSPTLVLYEAYPLYTLPTAFLVAAALFALGRFERGRREGWLLAFLAALSALVLLRSLYHAALLALAFALALWLSRARRRMAALGLLVVLPGLLWSLQTALVYGGPAGSSWGGCNLWKIASAGYAQNTLVTLARSGSIDPLVLRVPVFSPPSAYRPFGFERRSALPAQQRNDLHNVNVPAICRVYGSSALALIAHDPLHYAGNVARAYAQFSRPSGAHAHLQSNAQRLGAYGRLSLGPAFFALVPLAVLLGLVGVERRGPPLLARWQARPLLPSAALLIAYTVAVGSLADLGENERFKFAIEMPVLCVLAIRAHEFWQRRRGSPDAGGSDAYAGTTQKRARKKSGEAP